MLPPKTTCPVTGMPPKDPTLTMRETHPTDRRALVLKLSTQALQALEKQSQPSVDVELGSKPGIYINGAFFPVNRQEEGTSHDLYLRVATNPTAPLRPFATITGRVVVEPTLTPHLTDQLQQATLAAHTEKQRHTLKRIDGPPILSSTGKAPKKRQPDAARSRPSIASTSAPPQHAPPPVDSTTLEAAKIRAVRFYLRKTEATAQDAIKAVAPDADITYSKQLRKLLEEICEPISTGKKSSTIPILQLKDSVFLDIRPFEVPSLGHTDQRNLATAGKAALKRLGYKESDAAFGPYLEDTSYSSGPVRDTKGKAKAPEPRQDPPPKAKAKPAPPKKEAVSAPSPAKSASTSSTSARRSPPGSGYQRRKTDDTSSSSRVKTERVSMTPDLSRSRPPEPEPIQRIKSLRGGDSDTERDRSRHSPGADRSNPPSAKRRKPIKEEEEEDDDDEPLMAKKRRKTGEGTSVATGRKELPARPNTMKKEMSPSLPPPPVPAPKKVPRQSTPPQPRASSSKPADIRTRRRDITEYTSSEDEETPTARPTTKAPATKPPPAKRPPPVASPPPPPPPVPSSSSSGSASRHLKRSSQLNDVQRGREKYRKLYPTYLNAHTRLLQQQNALKDLLTDLEEQSSASITEEEGDAAPMAYEDLVQLKSEYAGYVKELAGIRKMLKLPAY